MLLCVAFSKGQKSVVLLLLLVATNNAGQPKTNEKKITHKSFFFALLDTLGMMNDAQEPVKTIATNISYGQFVSFSVPSVVRTHV